eukprot:g13214.t1
MAALVIKLRATSLSEPMGPNEKSISGIILIVINSTVILSGLISLLIGTSKGKSCIERLNKRKKLNKKGVTITPTNKDFSINSNDILKQNDVSTVSISPKPVSKKNRRMSMVSETLNSWKNENNSLAQHTAKDQAARHARLLERLRLSGHSKRKKPLKKLQEDSSLDLHYIFIKTSKNTYRSGDIIKVKISNLQRLGSAINFSGGEVQVSEPPMLITLPPCSTHPCPDPPRYNEGNCGIDTTHYWTMDHNKGVPTKFILKLRIPKINPPKRISIAVLTSNENLVVSRQLKTLTLSNKIMKHTRNLRFDYWSENQLQFQDDFLYDDEDYE